ncbi:fasciclin domain-containing protein [Pseudonocardiaceae bacterium YIM PH 21723]|nr:fasciclin domain-containing protein [Pseudonocardiaceae bacterium YIM PH 21723]
MLVKLKAAVLGTTVALALALTGCSDPGQSSNSGTTTSSSAAAAADGKTKKTDVFGESCSALPQGADKGSLDDMAEAPVATAASTNPLLTQLVALVTKANLGDTLNGQEAITVFAPSDAAFKALPEATVTDLTNNPDKLANVLKYHVIPKRYDKAGLIAAGEVASLQGQKVKITADGDTIKANDAKVICGNIPTKNATVFVVGSVLSPPSA